MTFLTKKDVEHCFDVIWFSIFDIQHSCLCSLNALNQMCRTYNVSVPASDNFEFPNSPCLNDWDLVHFVSHSNEPVFRVFHKCIMCCFLEQRIVVFRDGLCILKNSNSWLLLDALRDITKHEKDKENPFFYFFAVCEALMNLWRQRMNSTLAGSSQPRNVFALTWQREQSLSHAQQLRLELKEFCRGISFLFHEKMENAISYDPLGTSSSSPRPHATTTLMLYLQQVNGLYQQSVSLCETIDDKEPESQCRTFQTSLVANNFFGNIILSTCLIGATSGNSFGSNLNIPPYHSTKGIDGYLWYIVAAGSFVIWWSFLALFIFKNRSLLNYLNNLYKKKRKDINSIK